jgi:hypothetical protein
MPNHVWTAAQRRAFYTYVKERKRLYRDRLYEALESKCAHCGVPDSPDSELRIRFIDPSDPLKSQYRTNYGTLHRRLFLDVTLRKRVLLLCNICKLRNGTPYER